MYNKWILKCKHSPDDVVAVSCAAHRINNGFIKKDSKRRFDKKYEKSTCNSDLLYNYFFTDKKFDVNSTDKEQATEVIEYLKGLSFKAIERELTEFESNVLKLVSYRNYKGQVGYSSKFTKSLLK